MRPPRYAAVLLALLALAACIQPYKVDVRQGNRVTEEMVRLLEPGMDKSQVRFVLGAPLITDPFHQDRWDYVYLYKEHAGAPAQIRRLTVIFEGDTLARLEGDMAPAAGFTAGDRASESGDEEPVLPPG